MKKPSTPFPTSGYYGNEYFCDRESETNIIKNNMESGQSTTIVSIRRMGKTGLIRHIQHNKKDWLPVYTDILSTESLEGFLNALTSSILQNIPKKGKPANKLWKGIQSLRPVFSFDPLTGMPEVTFNVQHKEAENNIAAIFRLLEEQERPVLLAIDEFQQILNYPEKNTDAWLRSITQELQNVYFIFSGSHLNLMTTLFNDPSRPFYRSTQFLKLNSIPEEHYTSFIINQFEKHGRHITKETVGEILQWTRNHTYYVQLLCSRIYSTQTKKISSETWQEEAYKLLKEQEPVFYNYRELLTAMQWRLLKAIAGEQTLYSPTSGKFIQKNHLNSSAAVLKGLDALLDKEMIFYEFDNDGNKYYQVYDLLLQRWLERLIRI